MTGLALSLLLGTLGYGAGRRAGARRLAHQLSRDLRDRAAELQNWNPFAQEPQGMRYAADLITTHTKGGRL